MVRSYRSVLACGAGAVRAVWQLPPAGRAAPIGCAEPEVESSQARLLLTAGVCAAGLRMGEASDRGGLSSFIRPA